MTLIQLLLLTLSTFGVFLYFKILRSQTLDRVLALIMFALIILAIIFPMLTTQVANFLGVGRGADLLLYLLCFASGYAFLIFYSRLNTQHRAITQLCRELAILRAKKPQ